MRNVNVSVLREAEQLATLRGLPIKGIHAAMQAKVLRFGLHLGRSAWFIQDEHAGSVRRLDGKLWPSYNGSAPTKVLDTLGTSAIKLPGWPVGILTARAAEQIILLEGGPDLLAAFSIRAKLALRFGVVCLFGAGLTIHQQALPHFKGKAIRIITQSDEAGTDFAERIAKALAGTASEVSIASVIEFKTRTGEQAADLCEAIEFREIPSHIRSLFSFPSLSNSVQIIERQTHLTLTDVVTEEDGSTERTERTDRGQTTTEEGRGGVGEECFYDELKERAYALRNTRRGQTYRNLFQLGREVRAAEGETGPNETLRRVIFYLWYDASLPNVDPKESKTEYRARFLRSINAVRSPVGSNNALKLAEERAKTKPLPDIPNEPDAPQWLRMLAAVCRELQLLARGVPLSDDSRERVPFFIAKRDAMRIIGGRYPMDGHRALEALELFGVIKCVERGQARSPDSSKTPARASRYRYLLTLTPAPSEAP